MNQPGDYDAGHEDGKRDAQIENHAEQLRAIWVEVKKQGTWQNRAIGYATAIATAGSLLIGLLIEKLGWS